MRSTGWHVHIRALVGRKDAYADSETTTLIALKFYISGECIHFNKETKHNGFCDLQYMANSPVRYIFAIPKGRQYE